MANWSVIVDGKDNALIHSVLENLDVGGGIFFCRPLTEMKKNSYLKVTCMSTLWCLVR